MTRTTFGLVVLLVTNWGTADEPVRFDVAEARQPQLAVVAEGTVYCAFGADEAIYCARSRNGGESFGAPIKVATLPGLMLGKRRGPRIAATETSVVISAISRHEGNLVSWHSLDDGVSWSKSPRVNDADRACREGLHDMTADGSGRIGAVWLDLRNEKTELWSSFSSDDGATWSENQRVYRSPSGSICECCHPSLVGANGNWIALWRNSVAGNRDVYIAQSSDGGGSWSDATRLGRQRWPLAGCPMDGGDVAIGDEDVWTVWRREQTCFATEAGSSPQRERRLGTGEQPVVAVAKSGPVFAWLKRRPGDLVIQHGLTGEPITVAEHASDPCLVSTHDGEVFLAWEEIKDGETAVLITRLDTK